MRLSARLAMSVLLAGGTLLGSSFRGEGSLVPLGFWHPVTASPGAVNVSPTSLAEDVPRQLTLAVQDSFDIRTPNAWARVGGGAWTAIASPPLSATATLAYDPAAGGIVAVGECFPRAGTTCLALWNGSAWTTLPGGGTVPARFDATLAYDPGTARLVLYGGWDHSCFFTGCSPWRFFHDTWTWDGATWTQVATAHVPGISAGQALTYDRATRQVLLFTAGGNTCTTLPCASYDGAETWRWTGADWHDLAPLLAPPPRDGLFLSTVYDPADGAVLLFGGRSSTVAGLLDPTTSLGDTVATLTDTWAWNGVTWIPEPTAGPTTPGPMVYDVHRHGVEEMSSIPGDWLFTTIT